MNVTEKLLKWYKKNGRNLPWRIKGKPHHNPYEVWVSEIMLQQTTVKTVLTYYQRFISKYPDVFSLAKAPLDDVLMLWQGLGYYTRARKLHECAKVIVEQYDGVFPKNRKDLMKLPGIGGYTSAAIASIAFNLPEAVVDGNVIRVLSRLNGWESPVSEINKQIEDFAKILVEMADCPADYSSAIMDLGACVCVPKNPDCVNCPLKTECIALKENKVDKIPLIIKLKKEKKQGYVFLIQNEKGEFLVRKRTEKGLLSGLTEFPWNTDESFPFKADWQITDMQIKHIFTHIDLTLKIVKTVVKDVPENTDLFFVSKEELENYPFSTLMKKVIQKCNK